MQIAFEVIKILNDGRFHSGVKLADQLKVSRTSIWKAIQYLEKLGLCIDAVRAKGYRMYQPLELLNKSYILRALSKESMALVNRFEVLQAIPSTNDYLLAQIPYGLKSFSACVSEAQTQGKGRQGKVWQSPFGKNIYLSVYWQSQTIFRALSGLSLVIAMSFLSALESYQALPDALGIKWPNDIYYQNKKLAGILIETQTEAIQQKTHVVIGIGINLVASQSAQSNWANLQDVIQSHIGRNEFCARVLNHMIESIQQFKVSGFASFNSQWQKYDLLYQKPVTISVAGQSEPGYCLGVNERGELLVESDNTLKALTYGEVSIRPENAVIS